MITPHHQLFGYSEQLLLSFSSVFHNGNAPAQSPHGAASKPSSRFGKTENGERRLRAGLTKEKLGELAGLKPRTIYDWEYGRRISEARREAIERALEPYDKHTTQ